MTDADDNEIISEFMAEDEVPDDTFVDSNEFSDSSFRIEMKNFVLEALLERAYTVIPSKATSPILNNFQITAIAPSAGTDSRSVLKIVASDIENSVIASTDVVTVHRPGTAIFPAKRLLEMIKTADDSLVTIDVSEGMATISVGTANWKLKLQRGDAYPDMPDISDVDLFVVDKTRFLAGIKSVRYAAAKETVRQNLMLLNVDKGKITACDGARFQQASLGADFPPLSIQIPVLSVPHLLKLLASDVKEIKIGEGFGDDKEFLVFKIAKDTFIINKLVTDDFDVEEYILRPALANIDELLVERQELVEAIKRVRINADPETSAIALKLQPNQLTIDASDKWGNRAKEVLEVMYEKKDRTLVVNHQFLTQMLDMYAAKTCGFYLGEDMKSRKAPLVLKDDEEGTIGVIQQMAPEWL